MELGSCSSHCVSPMGSVNDNWQSVLGYTSRKYREMNAMSTGASQLNGLSESSMRLVLN